MEGSSLLKTILNSVSHTAAYGTAGKNHANVRIIQNPQGSEQTGGEGLHIGFFSIGQGIAACVQWQFLFKAQYPVAGFKILKSKQRLEVKLSRRMKKEKNSLKIPLNKKEN